MDSSGEQLLEKYLASNDQQAFEGLVRRYGPMVMGVCQRVLENPHDAEDAFQAAFVVLARKANAIEKRESIGSWLHGVAFRCAIKLRSMSVKRHQQLQAEIAQGAFDREADPAALWREMRPILDEELGQLPEKYRAPLILSYFEGRNSREVASTLGLSDDLVRKRVERGKDLLRDRLVRRGIVVSTAMLTVILFERTACAITPELAAATAKQSLSLAAGQTSGGAAVSPRVAGIARDVMEAMELNRLWTAASITLGVVGILGTILLTAYLARSPTGSTPVSSSPSTTASEKESVLTEPLIVKGRIPQSEHVLPVERTRSEEPQKVFPPDARESALAGSPAGEAETMDGKAFCPPPKKTPAYRPPPEATPVKAPPSTPSSPPAEVVVADAPPPGQPTAPVEKTVDPKSAPESRPNADARENTKREPQTTLIATRETGFGNFPVSPAPPTTSGTNVDSGASARLLKKASALQNQVDKLLTAAQTTGGRKRMAAEQFQTDMVHLTTAFDELKESASHQTLATSQQELVQTALNRCEGRIKELCLEAGKVNLPDICFFSTASQTRTCNQFIKEIRSLQQQAAVIQGNDNKMDFKTKLTPQQRQEEVERLMATYKELADRLKADSYKISMERLCDTLTELNRTGATLRNLGPDLVRRGKLGGTE
jgi:RNA polymerase sigma factor (sigma-70 family)